MWPSSVQSSLLLCMLPLCADAARTLDSPKVLVTAPPSYAKRLRSFLEERGARVVSCPAVHTELLSRRDAKRLRRELLNGEYDYVAFTSRRGVEGAMRACGPRLGRRFARGRPTAIALGADADALGSYGVPRDRVLVPSKASPAGVVSLLRQRVPRKERATTTVLCPVPHIVGLSEPPVVPNFIASLRRAGFSCERTPAYTTRWPGPSRGARAAVQRLADFDAIAITSTAEAEGLKRFCDLYNVNLRRGHAAGVPIVVHGPVTAGGAQRCGVRVAAVNREFGSFAGLADTVMRVCALRLMGAWVLDVVDGSWLLD